MWGSDGGGGVTAMSVSGGGPVWTPLAEANTSGNDYAGVWIAQVGPPDPGDPVITDGPYPESKELLAGYRLIDVDSAERALEIAARASAAPGQNGMPIQQPIEVREVLSAPDPEV